MTRSNWKSLVPGLVVAAGMMTMGAARAADTKAKEGQITGTVHLIDKDKSMLVVWKGTTERQVIYSGDTQWTTGTQASHKPSTLDQLKENWYIDCVGKFDGAKLVASACRFRESK